MQCPHLSVKGEKKICKRMEEEGMGGEVSDFDVQHYCQGNPNNCYYFRISEKDIKKHRFSLILTTA